MPMTPPAQMQTMSLPGVDQAVQQKESNALRNDAAKFQNEENAGRQQVRDQMEDAKFLNEIGTGYLERLEQDPKAYFNSYDDLKAEFTARGLDQFAEKMSPAITNPEQLKQEFTKLRDIGANGMAGRGPETTYGQPVKGVNSDTGNPEWLRPDSKGGLGRTGQEALPAGSGVNIYTGDEAQQAGDTQEEKKLADLRVETYAALQESARSSEETMVNIDIMRQLDFDGGPGTDFKQSLKKFAVAIGLGGAFNEVEIAATDSFNALAGDVLLKKMAKQKGPQTDRDYERIERTFANVNDIKLGREFLMNSAYALGAREIKMAEFYRNHFETNRTLRGADKAWNTWKRSHPMVSDSVLDPETGLPMFYIDYVDMMQSGNPGMPIEDIEKRWLQKTVGK